MSFLNAPRRDRRAPGVVNTRGLRGSHQLEVLVTHELDLRGMTDVLDVVTILELSFDAQYEDPAIHDIARVRADRWKQTTIEHPNCMRSVSLQSNLCCCQTVMARTVCVHMKLVHLGTGA